PALAALVLPAQIELAQPVAGLAHAERRVEAEHLRRELGQADPAARTTARFRVAARPLLSVHQRSQLALPSAQRRLDRVGESGAATRIDDHAIDHQLDGVLLQLLEGLHVFETHHHAVDPGPAETGAPRLLEKLAELALSVLDLGGKQRQL